MDRNVSSRVKSWRSSYVLYSQIPLISRIENWRVGLGR